MHPYQIIKNITIPYKTEFTKTRVGLQKDGAYILLEELIESAECVVSLGIGDNVEFDTDIVERFGKKCYMADFSVDGPPIENEHFFFLKEFINKDNFDRFLDHFGLRENKNMILKIDIEGGEYDCLTRLEESTLLKFSQIGAEFHNLLSEPARYIDLLNKLNKSFYVTHVHANNIGHIHDGLPETIEISFVRKDLVKDPTPDDKPCPDPKLDFSNHSNRADYVLDWWCPKKPTNSITYTISEWYGRLGNNIQQITNAIYYCSKKKFNFYCPPHQNIKQIAVKFGENRNFSSRFFFYDGNEKDFEADIHDLNYSRRELCLKYVLPSLKMDVGVPFDEDTLVIHIRSGDIFIDNPHRLYVQNPLWYYEEIIKDYSKVILVTEKDSNNPVVMELVKNPKVKVQASTIEEDFATLLRAKNLVSSGVSTFSAAAALCSKNIQNFYCSNIYLTEHLNPTMLYNTDINIIMTNIKNYIRIGEWKNTYEQRMLMINHKRQ